MRLLITGFVLLTACLLYLVYAFRQAGPGSQPLVEGPPRTTSVMVWKATRGQSVLWLCGSMHLLSAADYPLPTPYLEALEQSRHVVMELAPGPDKERLVKEALENLGTLPEGRTLSAVLQPATWSALQDWATREGHHAGHFSKVQPWKAALMMTSLNQSRRGYSSGHGLETYFSSRLGDRTSAGLETAAQQLGSLAALEPRVQEAMILESADRQSQGAARMKALRKAWAQGDADGLAALMDQEFRDLSEVRTILLDQRNTAWLPELEKLLAGQQTSMFLAGAAHFCGPGGVVALLEAKGVTVEQQSWNTTRPLPE